MIVSGRFPRTRLLDNRREGGLADRLLLVISYDMGISHKRSGRSLLRCSEVLVLFDIQQIARVTHLKPPSRYLHFQFCCTTKPRFVVNTLFASHSRNHLAGSRTHGNASTEAIIGVFAYPSPNAGERLGHTAVRYRPTHSALGCQHAPEFHPRICKGTQALRSRSGVRTGYRHSAAAAQGMSRCSLDRCTCRFPPRLCCPQRQNSDASAHSDGSCSWLYRSPPRQ